MRTKERKVSLRVQIFKIQDVCSASVELNDLNFMFFFLLVANEMRRDNIKSDNDAG